jgi:hypothetical protein
MQIILLSGGFMAGYLLSTSLEKILVETKRSSEVNQQDSWFTPLEQPGRKSTGK